MRFLTEYERREIANLTDEALIMIRRKSNDQIQQILANEVIRLRQLLKFHHVDN